MCSRLLSLTLHRFHQHQGRRAGPLKIDPYPPKNIYALGQKKTLHSGERRVSVLLWRSADYECGINDVLVFVSGVYGAVLNLHGETLGLKHIDCLVVFLAELLTACTRDVSGFDYHCVLPPRVRSMRLRMV